MELRVVAERVELVGPTEAGLAVPEDVEAALQEWAKVVVAVRRLEPPADTTAIEVVSRRGRQLARRVATVLDMPIDYRDPLTDEVSVVEPELSESFTPHLSHLPLTPQEPTPWLTGITVSVLMAIVTVAAVLTLAVTLNENSAWLAAGANLVVTAGLTPSIWLARRVLIWRWVAFGVAFGLVVGWFGTLFVIL